MTDRNDDHGGEPLELSDDDGFDPATAEIVEDTEPRELAAELIGELDEASPAADGVAMSAEERDGGADVDLLGRFGAVSMDDEGLSLPVDVDQPVNAPAPEEVTREDLAELAAVEAELDTRWPETKIDPSLERIEKLMDLLGNPERSAPVIHVAGTNGKTSTVRMIESLVRALGRRTGRTTSPHLQLATERIDIDGNGVVWTALAGSSHLARFDRSKCKSLTGPRKADGSDCAEGWTLFETDGPSLKGTSVPADFHYYNWVDRFNVSGLGENTPFATGSWSEALLALDPDTGKWLTFRVPYPLGFYHRGMDGRIDDPDAGWKGRALWANYGTHLIWHVEGGKGTVGKAVRFQIRPDPLAH